MGEYKCECGYEGSLEWVKNIRKTENGRWEEEGQGCPECKSLLSTGKIKEVKKEK